MLSVKNIGKKIPKEILLILLLGLLLRIYKFSSFFDFGHEQDLQAWIVRDILINHHPRLIGQETSIPGLFIGPLYYYLLVPFFALFNLDPRASIIPITFISLATIASVYYVVSKLFGKTTGKIALIIYALSPAIIFLDRWVVPTQPTLLWTIWFFYVVLNLLKGNFKIAPTLIVLIALIWHIHIAFVPLLILIPIAVFLSGKNISRETKKIDRKKLKLSIIVAAVLLLPLVAFEFRHGFQQIGGLLNINTTRAEQAKELREGYYKVEVITEYMNRVIWSPILYQTNPKRPSLAKIPLMLFIFLAVIFTLYKKKALSKNQMYLIFLWIAIVALSQFFSKRLMSDYYFNNLLIISLVIFSLAISLVYSNKKRRSWVLFAGALFLLFGLGKVITKKPRREFEHRKAIVEYIAKDVKEKEYPCVAINYIGDIPVRYGYRYLFWWKGISQITPGNDVPVYSIVEPFTISESEVSKVSGDVGVILPQNPQNPNKSLCNKSGRQLLPLNGFVN